MKRIAVWILWLLAVALGLLLCLWLLSRFRAPTAAQTAALAAMQERAPLPPGANAFPAVWLLDYDVPSAQREALALADIDRIHRAKPAAAEGIPLAPDRATLDGFEQQAPSDADRGLFCSLQDATCLDRVRADPAAYQALIDRHRPLLDRVVALQGHTYYRTPEPYRLLTMMPPVHYAGYDLTRLASQFAGGDVDAALAGTCAGADAWRRIGATADSLMVRASGSGLVEGYARLLIAMLGELPASHALPASCAVAFAPPTVADASICEAARGEFALSRQYVRDAMEQDGAGVDPTTGALLKTLVWDPEKTFAAIAVRDAWACSTATADALRNDIRIEPSHTRQSLWRIDCVANISGCLLTDIASPAYVDFQWKAQDHAARLELMSALLWLRSNASPDQTAQAQLTRYWDANRRTDRQLRFDNDGRSVSLQQYAHGPDEGWKLPRLPQAGEQVTAANAE